MAGRISASAVLYRNDPSQIAAALRSTANSGGVVAISAIDNSPTDNLRAVAEGAGAQYHWTGANLGFGKGHNLARTRIRDVAADYHVFVNPDVYFEPNVLPALAAFLDEHPDVAAVMPKVLSPDGTIQHLCRRPPRPADLFLRRFAPARLKERADRRLARFEMRDLDQSGPSDVPILSGCFMLVRRANLERVGGFDERFFLYLEDYDLCNRLRQTGRLVYLPTVAIHHHHGRHSYRRIKPLLLHLRSAQQYFGKWGWLPLY